MRVNHFRRKFLLSLINGLALISLPEVTFANPEGGIVTSGTATISTPAANTVQIQQVTNKAVINWNSFNVAPHEIVNFQQPSSKSVTLNRIDPSKGASTIYGQVNANGQIILSNPAGIWFGPNAYINVGGMIATTTNITEVDFMAGRLKFMQDPQWTGAVINEGHIKAAEAGLVALIGPAVVNHGHIEANLGTVALGAGSEFTINFSGNDMIGFTVDKEVLKRAKDQHGNELTDGVTNNGKIIANGGKVIMSADNARAVLNNTINMSGYVEANSVATKNGEIILSGGNGGRVKVTGQIVATGKDEGTKGGKVVVTGNSFFAEESAKINVSGQNGGGDIIIGGNPLGNGPLPNANVVVLTKNVALNADAISQGNGGNISLWAEKNILVQGKLSSRGGYEQGHGGLVEVGSNKELNIDGVFVNTKANHGNKGNLLLELHNAFITNGNADNNFIRLSADDLQNNLERTNITVSSLKNANQAGDLVVNRSIAWDANSILTLNAENNIHINAMIQGTHGSLTVKASNTPHSITTNEQGVIEVSGFNLTQGRWYQSSENLPAFSVENNFTINNGSLPAANAEFVRVKGGEGTIDSPYQLTDIYGVQGIASNPSALAANYVLANDIDASSTINWNNQAGFISLGTLNTPFTGTFLGDGYAIDNLTINNNSTKGLVGLFGYTRNAMLKRISLHNINIIANGNGSNVGGLVGRATHTTIQDVEADGMVMVGNQDRTNSTLSCQITGGIVGRLDDKSSLSHITSNVSINSYMVNVPATYFNYIGGIVGAGSDSDIAHVQTAGSIVATAYENNGKVAIGGIGGQISGTLSGASNNGDIHVISDVGSSNNQTRGELSLGGIAGIADVGMIDSVTNTGDVLFSGVENGLVGGVVRIGGLIGENRSIVNQATHSGNVIATVSINGNAFSDSSLNLGGLAGINLADISNATMTGKVWLRTKIATHEINRSSVNLGGIVGQATASSKITDSVSHGSVYLNGLESRTSASTLTDITGEVNVGGLVGLNSGSIEMNRTETLKQSTDIHITSIAKPTSNVKVGGIVGFNLHGDIKNISFNGSINVESLVEKGGLLTIGGLVGHQSGTLSNAYNAAPITISLLRQKDLKTGGAVLTGGLVGLITRDGDKASIQDAYNMGRITVIGSAREATLITGGIVGANGLDESVTQSLGYAIPIAGGEVKNTYTAAQVAVHIPFYSNTIMTAGLVGYHQADGVLSGSYWDTARTTQPYAVGSGRGPVDLIRSGTLLGNGFGVNLSQHDTYNNWNFDHKWGIVEGASYPYLQSFYPEGQPRVLMGYVPVGNAGKHINLVTEGQLIDRAEVGADNSFYFIESRNHIFDHSLVMAYLAETHDKGNLIVVAPETNGSLVNLMVHQNTIQLGDEQLLVTSNYALSNLLGNLQDEDILFTIDAAHHVTLGGFNNPIVTLRTSPSTTFHINGEIKAYDEAITHLDFNGLISISNNVQSTGDQYYHAPVLLMNDVSLVGDHIRFAETVNGFSSLNIHAKETVTIDALVGGNDPLINLAIHAPTLQLNGAGVRTQIDQDYAANTILGRDTWIESMKGGYVSYLQSVNGNGHSLNILAERITLSNPTNLENVHAIGDGAHNALVINTNHNQVWTIQGRDEGVLRVAGINDQVYFTSMPSLVGGSGHNVFNFNEGSSVSGVLSGGSHITNMLNFASYHSPVNTQFTDHFQGHVLNAQGNTIASFYNIGIVVENNHHIQMPFFNAALPALAQGFALFKHDYAVLQQQLAQALYRQYMDSDNPTTPSALNISGAVAENIDEIMQEQKTFDQEVCVEAEDGNIKTCKMQEQI